jgi:CSLREA domain-containing protein
MRRQSIELGITRTFSLALVSILVLSALLATPGSVRAAGSLITVTDKRDSTNTGCSLREAIVAANTNDDYGGCPGGSGADQIYLSAGNYLLDLTGTDEDAAKSGDLDIRDDLVIVGAGQTAVNITVKPDSLYSDRIFHVKPPVNSSGNPTRKISVTFSNLTISSGSAHDIKGGGGILNDKATVTLNSVTIRNNTSSGRVGGGVANLSGSTMTINISTFVSNQASSGGAIYNGGNLTVTNSLLFNNGSEIGGGGIDNAPILSTEKAVITNTTLSENSSTTGGAGLSVSGHMQLMNVTIAGNKGTGIGVYLNENSHLTIQNTILSSPRVTDAVCVQTGAVEISPSLNGYNLISKYNPANPTFTECNFTVDTTNFVNFSPYLSETLSYEGSPTGYYTFTDTSSSNKAIDGVASGAPCPPNDQRLRGRPAGASCDIGAYEQGGSIYTLMLPYLRR